MNTSGKTISFCSLRQSRLIQGCAVFVLSLMLPICVAQPALSQETNPGLFRLQSLAPDTRTISTSGRAEIQVVPNKITVVLGAKNFDKSLQTSCTAVDQAVQHILQLAAKHGVDQADVQTADISITPVYTEGSTAYGSSLGANPVSKPVGYSAQQSIGVVLRKGQKAGAFIKEALSAGANFVESVSRETTDLKKYREETRSQALQAARQKAVALAAECGMKVGKPLHIQEGSVSCYQPGSQTSMNNISMNSSVAQQQTEESRADGDSLAIGRISVSSTINVIWQLE